MVIILSHKFVGGTGVDKSGGGMPGVCLPTSPGIQKKQKCKKKEEENMVPPHVDEGKGKFVPALN
jgi:hypothetical protein